MAHPQLDELITRLSSAGTAEDVIREQALKKGWSVEDVNGALALDRLRKHPLHPMRDTLSVPRSAVSTTTPAWIVVTLGVLILGTGIVAYGAYFQPNAKALLTQFLGTASTTVSTFSLPAIFERAPYNPYTFATSTRPEPAPSRSSGSSGSVATTPKPTGTTAQPAPTEAPVQTPPKATPQVARPNVYFTAVADGTSYRITWSSTNARSCTATGFSTDGAIGGAITVYPTASRTYTMTCTGDGGTDKESVAVTVAPADPEVPVVPQPNPPSLTFTASKSTVASGGSVLLTWNSTDATSCTATGDWSGARNADDSQTQSNITAAKSYTLTCTGSGGSVSRTIAVALEVVVPPPPPPPSAPTLTLSADKTTVASGGSVALTWSSANATSCTATGDWSGAKSTSGSQSQTGITAAKTYTLTCTGTGGSISRTVTVALEAVVTPPPSGSTVYSTPQLQTALAAAKGGETILLGAGTYTTLGISRAKPTSMVTIMSADSSNPVLMPGMEIDDCANLTFKNIELTVNTRTMTNVNVLHSTNVHLDKIEFHDPVSKNRGSLLFRWGSNLSVKNSEFYDMGGGVRLIATDSITVSGNDFHDLTGDAIQSNSTSNVTIKNNTITDIYSVPGDHPDAIQFFTTYQTEPARNIVITGNTYTRGEGGITQGIFMGNEVSSRYQDVTISGNRIIGGMYHGITIGEVDRATITNNIVQGYTDMPSWIYIGKSTASSVTNNRATSYMRENLGNEGLVFTNNEVIPQVPVGDTSILSVADDENGQLASVFSLSWLADLWTSIVAWFMSLFGK